MYFNLPCVNFIRCPRAFRRMLTSAGLLSTGVVEFGPEVTGKDQTTKMLLNDQDQVKQKNNLKVITEETCPIFLNGPLSIFQVVIGSALQSFSGVQQIE